LPAQLKRSATPHKRKRAQPNASKHKPEPRRTPALHDPKENENPVLTSVGNLKDPQTLTLYETLIETSRTMQALKPNDNLVKTLIKSLPKPYEILLRSFRKYFEMPLKL
jgi:hypothetical protein